MKLLVVDALVAIALFLSAPAIAAEKPLLSWQASGDRIAMPTAHLSLSKTAGSAVMTKTDEFSHKGEGLDNVAQFETPDRKIFGTAYVYLPAYPDAALTAYQTDKSIRDRFGAVTFTDQSVVASDGHPGTVIRLVYSDGRAEKVNGGEPVATAAAFLRVSGWIVKLRASGPAERRSEVIAVLDGLIAGLRFDKGAYVHPVGLFQLAPPCPAADRPAALSPKTDKTSTRALGAAIGLSAAIIDPKGKKDDLPRPFPNNGLQQACVRGTIKYGDSSIDLLQPVGSADPSAIVGVINDAGSMLVIEKALIPPGYDFKTTQIGVANIYGSYDAIPSVTQINALFSGTATEGTTRQASVKFKATGDTSIEIAMDGAK
ncbi:hypothetical protein [Sphingomonas sp.]|uniref:hypothetical protein n=1 Tax=Sphingomonas sp. TaxID=28214 RepID=UPI003D6D0CCD